MMVDLLEANAPLYGRFAARLPLAPLPFAPLADFFPGYAAAELAATYAVAGGVAGYLERFHPALSLGENIRQHLFQRTGMFRSEPTLVISDLVRETRNYEAALRAIAGGDHTPAGLARTTGISSPNLAPYLKRLLELGLVERRVPATIPPDKRRSTTRSRYHLADPFFQQFGLLRMVRDVFHIPGYLVTDHPRRQRYLQLNHHHCLAKRFAHAVTNSRLFIHSPPILGET
jgi:uncharacterized protein